MTWRQSIRVLVRDLLALAVIAAVFSGLYAAGELIIYGRVR